MEVFNGSENQLAGKILNGFTIIVYHRHRKSWRIFDNSQKSKWNKVLGYCQKSLEFTEDRFISRTLSDYLRSSAPGATYLIMYSKDDLSDYRTLEDLIKDNPAAFI